MRPENGYGSFLVKIRPNSGSASLQHIDQTFRALFPLDPFTYSFKEEENKKNYEAEARWKQILLFGAILTIFISCIGLFGLSVASAEKRKKEIGIRKVLGASVSGVVLILAKDFLRLVIIAIGVAIPLSRLAAGKWLANYPYRIGLSWWLFAGASLLVVFIAGVTICSQTIRAATVNPVKSLKTE
jgi:putative ABC transport system permease protein